MSHFKKAVVRSAILSTVTMSLVTGMALQEAAPAQAAAPLALVPIIGAWLASSGVSASGAATVGVSVGVVGAIMGFSQPGAIEWKEPFKDWFSPEPDAVPAEQEPTGPGESVQKDETIFLDYDGSDSPSQNNYLWETSGLKVNSFKLNTANGFKDSVTIAYEHMQGRPRAHSFNFTYTADIECRNPMTGVVAERTVTNFGPAVYQLTSWSGQDYPESFRKNKLDIRCPTRHTLANGNERFDHIISAKVRAPTTREKYDMSSSTAQNTAYYGAEGTLTWRASDHGGYAAPQYLTTVKCLDAGGNTVEISLGTDMGTGRLNIPSCKAAGLSDGATGMSVGFADGDTLKQPIWTTFPGGEPFLECEVALGKVCKMEIFIDGMPCAVGLVACVSWLGLQRTSPGRVECRYNGKVVDISGCFILEGAYAPGGSPVTELNVDGNPDTWTNPFNRPGWDADRDQVKFPLPNPDPLSPMEPDPEIDPEVPPKTEPTPPAIPGSELPPVRPEPPLPEPPVHVDGDPGVNQQNCLNGAVSWNPIDWVLVPVKCALTWAFVPKVAVETRITGMASNFDGKVPFAWFGVGTSPMGGGGCPTSWAVTVRGESYSLICGTAADGIIRAFRPVMGAMLIIAALWPLIRSMFYASIPIFKVTPS